MGRPCPKTTCRFLDTGCPLRFAFLNTNPQVPYRSQQWWPQKCASLPASLSAPDRHCGQSARMETLGAPMALPQWCARSSSTSKCFCSFSRSSFVVTEVSPRVLSWPTSCCLRSFPPRTTLLLGTGPSSWLAQTNHLRRIAVAAIAWYTWHGMAFASHLSFAPFDFSSWFTTGTSSSAFEWSPAFVSTFSPSADSSGNF